jgi:hypothetical protein
MRYAPVEFRVEGLLPRLGSSYRHARTVGAANQTTPTAWKAVSIPPHDIGAKRRPLPEATSAPKLVVLRYPSATRMNFCELVPSRKHLISWCCCPDSNGGPTDYESCVELNRIKDLGDSL